MDWRTLDLNLLRVLDTMMIELNTPRVAARIEISRMRERTRELLAPLGSAPI